MDKTSRSEKVEIELVLTALSKCYGYDFHNYSESTVLRRLKKRIQTEGLRGVSEMIYYIINEQDFACNVIEDFSVVVTSFFRDEDFFRAIRKKVIPFLRTFPFFKIWHAGCCTGEEVYSMAILLKEAGLLERARIYATDINHKALAQAKEGIYSNEVIAKATENYRKANGKESFDKYFCCGYNSAIISPELTNHITFSAHNLVSDGVFGEMQMIVCRNVLIYFNRTLKKSVVNLFKESLYPGGLLCLGDKESLSFIVDPKDFSYFDKSSNIYKASNNNNPESTSFIDKCDYFS